jgi:hypothetical protein
MSGCKNLKRLELPHVSIIGLEFLRNNTELVDFIAPELAIIDPGFFQENELMRNQVVKQIDDFRGRMRI